MTSTVNRISMLALLLSAASSAAGATTVLLHNGANNPVAEGWSSYTSLSGTTAAPVYNDLGSGFDAWAVDDNSASSDTLRYYSKTLSSTEVSEGETAGWRLSVRLRIVNTPDSFVSVSGFGLASTIAALYRDASRDWYLGFGSEADGDPMLRLPGGGTFTLNGGGSGYHLYELVYDPAALSADLFIDGSERVSNLVGSSTAYHNSVLWGAATSPDVGQGNFNYVRFANSPAAVVPVPPAVLLMGSALFALAGLRRRQRGAGS